MRGHAVGNQGNWFAKVDASHCPEVHGKSLPCVWDFWWKPPASYRDEGFDPDHPKIGKFIDGLREHNYVVMRKRRKGDAHEWIADGYIAVFEIANVQTTDVLTFDIVRRVCNLD